MIDQSYFASPQAVKVSDVNIETFKELFSNAVATEEWVRFSCFIRMKEGQKMKINKIGLLSMSLIFLVCCDDSPEIYKLPNGEIVSCKRAYRSHCGIHLSGCSNGKRYGCVTNLERLPND